MIVNEEMKTLADEDGGKPPDEVKTPPPVISPVFIPSLAQRLHSFISPDRGDFIEKRFICPVDK